MFTTRLNQYLTKTCPEILYFEISFPRSTGLSSKGVFVDEIYGCYNSFYMGAIKGLGRDSSYLFGHPNDDETLYHSCVVENY